jgi:polyferredoxin
VSNGTYLPPPPAPPGGYYGPPAELGSIKTFFIVSLIVHALAALVWLLVVLKVGILTCGIGCALVVVPAFLIAAIAFDAMAVSKLDQPPNPAAIGTLRTAAILDIISGALGFSIVPLIMGILVIVSLQKPDIRQYYGVP